MRILRFLRSLSPLASMWAAAPPVALAVGLLLQDLKAGATAASLIVVTLAGAPDLLRAPLMVGLDKRYHQWRVGRWSAAEAISEEKAQRRAAWQERAVRLLLFYALLPLTTLATSCLLAAGLLALLSDGDNARSAVTITVLTVATGGWFLLGLLIVLSLPTDKTLAPHPDTTRVSLEDAVARFTRADVRRTLGLLALVLAAVLVF